MTEILGDEHAFMAELPVFPLPRTVLMPRGVLPLHVFEPRYRELVAHSLEHDRLLAIATLRPGFEAHYEGRPAVYSHVGVGRIAAYHPLPDGRSNVALQCIGRARLGDEVRLDRVFRCFEATLLGLDPTGAESVVTQVRRLVVQLGAYSQEAANEARRIVELEGEQFIDRLARRIFEGADEQLEYLRVDTLVDRATLVQGALATVLASRAAVAES